MYAPTDKTNRTIQIVVTRACSLFHCSNCTQLLPLRGCQDVPKDHDPVHMSPDVFRQALRSIRGWPFYRGIFGGNPCSHPQFAKLMEILVEEVPNQRQRELWSNDPLEHGELIRSVFLPHGKVNFNVHCDLDAAERIEAIMPGMTIRKSMTQPSWQTPILLSHRDLGISEADWVEARETCQFNAEWSGAIVERYGKPWGYFCEIASSLDAIRGTNHGIDIERTPDWWRLKMPSFDHQVKNCCDAGCGVPLRGLGHLDRDDVYDYSESFTPFVELTIKKKRRIAFKKQTESPGKTVRVTDYLGLRSEKPALETV